MAKITLQLERAHIRALLLFAGLSDIRFYLNGLCVESFADRALVAATDGRRMAVIRDDSEPARCPTSGVDGVTFIIPRDLLDKIKSSRVDPRVEIIYDTDTLMLTIVDGITQSAKKALDGRFPDYRRVIPTALTGIPEQIASESAADFGKVAKLLGCSHSSAVHIFHNGNPDGTGGNANLVEIQGHPEFIAIVMGNKNVRTTPRSDVTSFLGQPPKSRPMGVSSAEVVVDTVAA